MTYESVQPILNWIQENPNWSGFIVFLISLSESLAVVGLVVPGVVLMTAIGAMMGSGVLPFWSTLIWAILGAIAGDGISYYLGYHYHQHLRDFWPFRQFPKLLERGEAFFRAHGGKSIIFGRFVGPVRPMIPVIAGMMDMRPKKFLFFNILSAIVWAPIYSLPGILIGASLGTLSTEVASRVVLLLLLLLLMLWILYTFILKILIWMEGFIQKSLTNTWKQWKNANRLPLLRKILATKQGSEEGQLGIIFLFILASLLFIYCTYSVLYSINIAHWNESVYQLSRALYLENLVSGTLVFTGLGEPKVMVITAIAIGLWLLWKKQYFAVFCWLGIIFGGEILGLLIRDFVAMPRPDGIIFLSKSYAYPSGHTLSATLVYGGGAAFIRQNLPQEERWIPWVISIPLIILIALSRIYLGEHWFTDVIGGLILGIACVSAGLFFYRKYETRLPLIKDFLIPGLCVLILSFSVYMIHTFPKKRLSLVRHWPIRQLSIQEWWSGDVLTNPLYRNGAFKRTATLFDIEWLGSLDNIQKLLAKNGFHESPDFTFQNWLIVLKKNPTPDQIPVIPRFHRDRLPVLTMIKTINPTERQVIQIWRSDLVDNQGHPLWVGTLRVEDAKHPIPLVTIFTESSDNENTFKELTSLLSQDKKTIYKTIPVPPHLSNTQNHDILLVKERF